MTKKRVTEIQSALERINPWIEERMADNEILGELNEHDDLLQSIMLATEVLNEMVHKQRVGFFKWHKDRLAVRCMDFVVLMRAS